MIAAVFDCVVYVQALLSRKGPAFACLSLAEAEHVTLYVSTEILDEIERALSHERLRRKYTTTYVNLAIDRSARFVVTRDADLLDLMRDEHFQKSHPGITILDPVAFLRHVRTEVAKALGYE
jgi:predicted nucleic acid-binding protein